MKGKGMPITGIKPIDIPTFTNVWIAKIDVIPIARRLENLFFAIEAIRTPRKSKKISKESTTIAPINPNSSPGTQ